MSVTKEDAREAGSDLETAAVLLDQAIPDKDARNEIKRHLLRVQNFVEAAEKRLPTQAAVERDKERRKKKV